MISVSIIIPVYNEEKTIIKQLGLIDQKKIQLKDYVFEVIIVDDNSNDKTEILLKENKKLYDKYYRNEKNFGKGYSVNVGINNSTSDIILIQDADLEYLPENYENLLKPFKDYDADVVYGSRFKTTEINRVLFFFHSIANKIITFSSNIFSDLNLTDVEVGYKLFKRKLFEKINIKENSFGFEIEVTHKISNLRKDLKIFEVGISYFGRSYAEGKKIGIKDAFWAFFCILKYGLFKIK